ncbi:imm11 family protein [Corallococcus sp. AS-1-12]|uniref:imm11 family protein n=1 Tax=Corallococcus sp. AS-1-12 TaxID=2874598 RepID=UPI00351D79FD|nr:suppressor of fused domain protein [Corallococcus sp. AS-1-12]
MRYFNLFENVAEGFWCLGHPLDGQTRELEDPWQFTVGEPARFKGPIRLPLDVEGVSRDYSHAAFSTPVVNARLAALFQELAPNDVELIPVEIDSHAGPYFILNALRAIPCVDTEASSDVVYWSEEDGIPEKVGTLSFISEMRIDTSKVGDAKVFRPSEWDVVLIVSEDIKDAMERAGITGAKFEAVTGPPTVDPVRRAETKKRGALWDQARRARAAVWRGLGTMSDDFYIPPVVGGPWPGERQWWTAMRRPDGGMLIVTDGLSDPFNDILDRPTAGFGLELAIETPEPLGEVWKSWPVHLLERVAYEVAEFEKLRVSLANGTLSMEVDGVGMPETLVTPEGRVAVLIGMETDSLPPRFTLPGGEVRLLTVKVLMPAELKWLLRQGRGAAAELIRRFKAAGETHLSRSWRQPVVS